VGDTAAALLPLQDARLRRALLHGLDRAALCQTVMRGQAVPATGLVPPGLLGFPLRTGNTQGPDPLYNPQLAAQLLAQAGYPGGQGLAPLTLYTTPNYRLISEWAQHQLAQLGIRVQVEEREGATLREAIYGGQAQFWRASWIADYPDPENFLGLLHSAQWAPGGPNTTRFALPAYDSLLATALAQPTDSLRASLYARLDSLAVAQAPIIPLFFYQTVRLLKPHVQGWAHSPSPLVLDLRSVQVPPQP
jgi:peptide/nickel transport system substrate-binding protein